MLPEIAELSSDYLGNTVVQKLFEHCSESTKEQMLIQIAHHLAEIGVHKNGTWAAQKIIDVTKAPTQMKMIVECLRPYTVPLFLDQYGNYVLQCCLRFGSPYNDFIFETMLSKMWEIAQGRFGARAMRACLESHHASKDQQRMLAAAIALHNVQLATNANGALLLTWLLDTCTFPHRRTVLAPRLVPHLVHLCTHKVAYLTVLKVINQRNEPEARETVLKALFFSSGDEVLESILNDPTSGATLIFKVLTTPFFDESIRVEVIKNVSKVLTKLKATPSQGYKRLMDEVGLSSRGGSRDHHSGRDGTTGHSNTEKSQHRSNSRQASSNYRSQTNMERQHNNQFIPNPISQNSENSASATRSASSEQNTASSSTDHGANNINGLGSVNATGGMSSLNTLSGVSSSGYSQDPILPMSQQQIQYQAYLQSRNVSPAGIYPNIAGTNFGGYAASPPIDTFRGLQTHTPILSGPSSQINPNPILSQPTFAPPQYSPVLNTTQMYPYPPAYYPQAQAIPNQSTGGRHGRVSLSNLCRFQIECGDTNL
jgi:protein JSN1